MKIGILTLPLHTNYGGILQAYALQTVLERLGHEVVVLDRVRKPRVDIPISVIIKRWIKKHILCRKLAPIPQLEEYKRQAERNRNTWRFADKYINRYEIDNVDGIKKGDFDAIVVGSDQIWRRQYIRNSFRALDEAYLSFTDGWQIRRVAYAPSFGVDQWEYAEDETQRIGRLLRKFDNISVRELSGVNLCEKYLGLNVRQMVDPTMLLTAEDYMTIAKNSPRSKGNLLCYVLDLSEEKQQEICQIAEARGLIPFCVNANVEAEWGTDKVSIQPPVEQWIRGFMDAELVVTDSFHACVFSIIFNKEFIFLGNASRGSSRVETILHIFGNKPKNDRMTCLATKREEGLQYLRKALCHE